MGGGVPLASRLSEGRAPMVDVQIGRGKRARQAYELDDLVIVPSRRLRDRDDVDLAWKIDAYRFRLPVVTPVESGTASAAVAAAGALPVLDLEGLVQTSAPDVGAIRDAIAAARGEGRIAVRVSPTRAAELVPVGVRAEAELIVIQGDVVSAEHVSSEGDSDLRTLIRSTDVPVVVGGCVSYHTALHLMRTGAAGVIVGGGRPDLGIDVPLATAIAEVRAARVRHLDETSVYCHLVAMGDISTGVDAAKAIAVGADAVMTDVDTVTGGELADSLRSSMAACGYTPVKEFQRAEVAVR